MNHFKLHVNYWDEHDERGLYLTISKNNEVIWESHRYNNLELYLEGSMPELREEFQIICDHNNIRCYCDTDIIEDWTIEE